MSGSLNMGIEDYLGRVRSFGVIQIEKVCAWLALIAAIIWYPYTHLYSYFSSVGYLPRFMDGAFGVFALLCTVLMGFLFITGDARRLYVSSALITFLCFFFVIYCFCWVAIYFLFSSGLTGNVELFKYYSRILLDYVFLFLVGLYFRPERWSKVFAFFYTIMLVCAFVFIDWDRMMIDLRNVVDPAYKGVYLGLSTTALFTGLFTWSAVKTKLSRLVVLATMIPLLFFMGSRADFGAFLILLPVALSLTLKPLKQFMVYISGGILTLLGLLIIGVDKLAVSRHFQILNLEQFTSLLARNELFLWGMERVAASPLFGDYGGTLEVRGTIGSYIHNLFSVWQAFGPLPFIIYTALVVMVVFIALLLFFKQGRQLDRQAQLVVMLGLLTAVEVLVAKSLGWPHVALAWGLTAGFLQAKWKSTNHDLNDMNST
jgi:hypothetical protein